MPRKKANASAAIRAYLIANPFGLRSRLKASNSSTIEPDAGRRLGLVGAVGLVGHLASERMDPDFWRIERCPIMPMRACKGKARRPGLSKKPQTVLGRFGVFSKTLYNCRLEIAFGGRLIKGLWASELCDVRNDLRVVRSICSFLASGMHSERKETAMRKLWTLTLTAFCTLAGSAVAQHATVGVPFQTNSNNYFEQIGVNFNFHSNNFFFQQNSFGLASPQFGGATAQCRRDDRLCSAAVGRRGLLQYQCQPRQPVQQRFANSQRHAH